MLSWGGSKKCLFLFFIFLTWILGTEYFEGYKLANQTNYLKNQLKWVFILFFTLQKAFSTNASYRQRTG
jgi:hypothetical protein